MKSCHAILILSLLLVLLLPTTVLSEATSTASLQVLTENGAIVESLITSCFTVEAVAPSPRAELIITLSQADGSVAEERRFACAQGKNSVQIALESFAHFDPMNCTLKVALQEGETPLLEPLVIRAAAMDENGAVSFDSASFRFYIGPLTQQVRGLIIMDGHGTGNATFDDWAFRGFLIENDWAALLFNDSADKEANPQTWQMLTEFMGSDERVARADAAIETAIAFFARQSGHPELTNVPRATFGHSAATSFAIKYGAYHPEKVFASIAWRSHDKHPFAELSRDVPVLVMQGEIDGKLGGMMWLEGAVPGYGNNAKQLDLCTALVMQGYPVTYVLSPGADHGSGGAVMDRSIIQKYLLCAYAARVPENADFSKGPAELLPIDFSSGYYGDLSNVYDYFITDGEKKDYAFGKIGQFENAADQYSWLWDETFANQWKEYAQTRNVRKYR